MYIRIMVWRSPFVLSSARPLAYTCHRAVGYILIRIDWNFPWVSRTKTSRSNSHFEGLRWLWGCGVVGFYVCTRYKNRPICWRSKAKVTVTINRMWLVINPYSSHCMRLFMKHHSIGRNHTRCHEWSRSLDQWSRWQRSNFAYLNR